jgi:hypothetical protein
LVGRLLATGDIIADGNATTGVAAAVCSDDDEHAASSVAMIAADDFWNRIVID